MVGSEFICVVDNAAICAVVICETFMGELITLSLHDYEEKAVSLAGNVKDYQRIRRRLAQEREHSSLFDAPSMVRDLEGLFEELVTDLGEKTS